MGWWDSISSFASGLSDNVWKLENLLQGFVREYALWGASQANNYFSILNHTWSDVTNTIDNKMGGYYNNVNDFYGTLQNKLESSYSMLNKSWYNVTNYVDNAVSGFQSQVNSLSNNASSLYSYAHITLKNEINSLSQDIDNITDDVSGITRSALKTVSFISVEAEKRWGILKKSWSDVTVLVSNNIITLKTSTINPIIADLSGLTGKVNTLITTTTKQLQSDLTAVTINLNKLTNDVVRPLKGDFLALKAVVNGFPTWITKSFDDIALDLVEAFIKVFSAPGDKSVRFLTALGIGAGEIITTILDTPKDMVSWIKNDIADVLEDILDRVFK